MKIVSCQFSNTLINGNYSNTIADKYYNGIYEKKEIDGYYNSKDFFEIPLWIAELSGAIKDKEIEAELYIIEDLETAIKYLANKDDSYFCFSVLDVNKKYIKEIAQTLFFKTFLVGGYIDFSYFKGIDNIKVFNSIKHLTEYLKIPYEYNLDYTLFTGYKTIPRLTLSYGCLNRCKFCTVEKSITMVNEFDVLKQIESFKCLDFKLVYLNDKTFSQANNFMLLSELYGLIKEYNKEFKGFIVQTTVIQVNELIPLIEKGIIYAIEMGIESFNDSILYGLNKPQTELNIIAAVELLKGYNVKIIPNIIIGFIEENMETYQNTLNFIKQYINDIYLLNIYNLAIYQDTELSKEINIKSIKDLNENITNKTFYSDTQLQANEYFYNEIFKLALQIIKR